MDLPPALVTLVLFFLSAGDVCSQLMEEEKKPTYLNAAVGESVVFNCPLDFPHDVAIPYVLRWNKEQRTVFSSNDGELSATEGYEHRVSLVPPGSALGKGSINLTAIRETDAGWYECRIFFPNRTPNTRPNGTWFHLSVDGDNLLTVPPTNQTIMEGKPVEITCITKEPESTVSWYKDGTLLSELPDLLERSWVAPEGSLTIRQTSMADLGSYTCEVVDQKGDKQAASAYLNVTYPAKVVYSPQELFLPYGRPSLLDCHFRANPPLITLRWEKDGFLYDPLNVQGVFYRKNGSLYFEKVDESHGGEYTCTPFNSLGTAGPSPPIHVVVQRPPVFTVTPQNLYLRKSGDSLEIPCDALDGDGTHRPNIVWFKKDGTPLPVGRAVVTGGNLTLTNIQEVDRGLYQCVASNEAATITSETELMVENSVPRAPHNLTSKSTPTSITVRWLPGSPRANAEYSIWYRPSDVPEWRTMRIQSKGTSEATVTNLLPGREYEMMVLSQDSQGDGMFSKAFRARTKGDVMDLSNLSEINSPQLRASTTLRPQTLPSKPSTVAPSPHTHTSPTTTTTKKPSVGRSTKITTKKITSYSEQFHTKRMEYIKAEHDMRIRVLQEELSYWELMRQLAVSRSLMHQPDDPTISLQSDEVPPTTEPTNDDNLIFIVSN